MAAVVIIETVDDPCAVFNKAAIKKGSNSPISKSINPWLITSLIDVALRIFPNAPPAPVMRIIVPAAFSPSATQLKCCSLERSRIEIIAIKTPKRIAMIG